MAHVPTVSCSLAGRPGENISHTRLLSFHIFYFPVFLFFFQVVLLSPISSQGTAQDEDVGIDDTFRRYKCLGGRFNETRLLRHFFRAYIQHDCTSIQRCVQL